MIIFTVVSLTFFTLTRRNTPPLMNFTMTWLGRQVERITTPRSLSFSVSLSIKCQTCTSTHVRFGTWVVSTIVQGLTPTSIPSLLDVVLLLDFGENSLYYFAWSGYGFLGLVRCVNDNRSVYLHQHS